MADLPPYGDQSQDTGVRPGTPRWVKVFGIVAIVLALLFVISLLAGVRHGPGMHTPSGNAGNYTLATSGKHNIGGVDGWTGTSAVARMVEVSQPAHDQASMRGWSRIS